MLKECKVIRLATESKSHIVYDELRKDLFYGDFATRAENRFGYCTNQHLYIISDDTITEGDWYIYANEFGEYSLRRCYNRDDKWLYSSRNKSKWNLVRKSKKVIASTDSNILQDYIAKIPKEFLEQYCNANGIKIIQVEYINKMPKDCAGHIVLQLIEHGKIRAKNNVCFDIKIGDKLLYKPAHTDKGRIVYLKEIRLTPNGMNDRSLIAVLKAATDLNSTGYVQATSDKFTVIEDEYYSKQ